MVMHEYSKRLFLNEEGHSSTGAVVAFHGYSPWLCDGEREVTTFLEISDCRRKVTLHRAGLDTMGEFVAKMEKLHAVIDGFIAHLKSED
jgi:hypothetical protein